MATPEPFEPGVPIGRPPRFPCTGRVCIGKCLGACPAGYMCQRNNYGLYRCIKEPPEVWEQWWFWVVLVVGVILLIGLLYLIFRLVKMRRNARGVQVTEVTEAVKPGFPPDSRYPR